MPVVGEGMDIPVPEKKKSAEIIGDKPGKPTSPGSLAVNKALEGPGPFEVTNDTRFTIDFYVKEHDGRWVLTAKSDPAGTAHKAVFRMWSFGEMIELKKKCSQFDRMNRIHSIDVDLLNRLKVQKLMQSWTLSDYNERLIIHRVNGVMTDGAWEAFIKVSPNITTFIIDSMNFILENG